MIVACIRTEFTTFYRRSHGNLSGFHLSEFSILVELEFGVTVMIFVEEGKLEKNP